MHKYWLSSCYSLSADWKEEIILGHYVLYIVNSLTGANNSPAYGTNNLLNIPRHHMQFFIYTCILCWFVFKERKQGNLGQEIRLNLRTQRAPLSLS